MSRSWMRRRVLGLVASASLVLVLAGCGQGEVKSDIELTSPTSSNQAMETSFGPAVAETARADASSEPRDPAAEDVAPVSLTAEPVPVPAN